MACILVDRIGAAASANGVILDIAIYGGSALMIASNFRFATEDVDMAEIGQPWPAWLATEVDAIAADNDWSREWLNDAVQFHLSPLADSAVDHQEFGTFPRDGLPGLRVSVPSAEYMLALKLKSMRINDPAKGARETADIRGLILAGNIKSIDDAIAVLAKFFPKSAREPDAQRFLLKHIWPEQGDDDVPPRYPLGRR
jgi:hypothetical protein